MAVTYGFFNAIQQNDGSYDRTYNADQMSTYFEGLVGDGVYENIGDAMQVVASSGMQVQVKSGRMLIESRWLKNDAAYPIMINSAHVTLNRYTAIVARLDLTSRTITLVAKDGENASDPAKPEMINSQTMKEMCLAYVYVARGATAISQSNIVDCRADSNVCGWVTGIIQQVDTSKLYLQWQTAYEEFYKQMQEWKQQQEDSFDKWFSTLTSKLQVNTKITEKRWTMTQSGSSTTGFPIELTFTPGTDILYVNLNGVMLVEGTDYTLESTTNGTNIKLTNAVEAGNTFEFRVLQSKIG